MENEEQKRKRRKRVNRLKKMILVTVALAILIPTTLSIILGIRLKINSGRVAALENKVDQLQQENEELQMQVEDWKEWVAGEQQIPSEPISGCFGAPVPSGMQEDAMPKETIRKVYLTFDDGPSVYTSEILDILKQYHVKATFFVVGKPEEKYDALYKRIVEEGHTLGMHSYSHKYNEIYASREAFAADLQKLRSFLKEKTGVECRFCRFPGGSSNTVSSVDMMQLIDYLKEQGIIYFDWNISSGDASTGYVSKNKLISNCTDSLAGYETAVILLHDAAEKRTTVEALPELIEKIQEMDNTVLLPITEDTEPVQHIKSESEE